MTELVLYVGNKNYSSWSFRPWMALKAAGIPFRDQVIRFDFAGGNAAIKAISPSGKVPLLDHDGLKIWESLAIIEYAAELFADKPVWPKDQKDRALARSISMEMATGFSALRNACPMNLRRPKRAITRTGGLEADIHRIEKIWHSCLEASQGPFLFGAFSAVDAMFAPVVNRLEAYCLTDHPKSLGYMAAMKNHPAWLAWEKDALGEPWIVEEDEA